MLVRMRRNRSRRTATSTIWFGHLEGGVAGIGDDLRDDRHALVEGTGQAPVLHLLRKRKVAREAMGLIQIAPPRVCYGQPPKKLTPCEPGQSHLRVRKPAFLPRSC